MKIDKDSPIKFLEESSSASKGGMSDEISPLSDLVASLKTNPQSNEKKPDFTHEETKDVSEFLSDPNEIGARPSRKFSPSKNKYRANPTETRVSKIGADSDDEQPGFMIHKVEEI